MTLTTRLCVALVFGCFLGLCSPGFNQWWIAWIGIAPLLVLISLCASQAASLAVGLCFGITYNLVSMSWWLGLYPLDWLSIAGPQALGITILFWLTASALRALLFAGFSWFVYALPMRAGALPYHVRPYFPYLLCVPLVWIFCQWMLGELLPPSINQLAYSQCNQQAVIALARWGGSPLVEFVLLAFNTALAAALITLAGFGKPLAERADRISPKMGAVLDCAIVLLLVGFLHVIGSLRVQKIAQEVNLVRSSDNTPYGVPVAVIQGGSYCYEKGKAQACTASYQMLCGSMAVPLLVLPQAIFSTGLHGSGLLISKLQITAQKTQAELVIGGTAERGGGPLAQMVSGAATTPEHALKDRGINGQRLRNWLLSAIVGSNNAQLGPLFADDEGSGILASRRGRIGVSQGFQIACPAMLSNEARHGAKLLMHLADLSCFHNSRLNDAVLACAILRAVENGRYLALCTNTGISAVIDPSGQISSCSVPGSKGILVDTVQFLEQQTPYTQMWWL